MGCPEWCPWPESHGDLLPAPPLLLLRQCRSSSGPWGHSSSPTMPANTAFTVVSALELDLQLLVLYCLWLPPDFELCYLCEGVNPADFSGYYSGLYVDKEICLIVCWAYTLLNPWRVLGCLQQNLCCLLPYGRDTIEVLLRREAKASSILPYQTPCAAEA